MSDTGNETLQKIQQEIKETIEREKELKKEYAKKKPLTNNKNNGILLCKSKSYENPSTNGYRRFTPNPSTKGVMHKFLKMHSKLNGTSTLNKSSSNKMMSQINWHSLDFEPAKMNMESGGKPLRNGFVSAEEKMKRELMEFQQRENELRNERRKSQPDLMAALLAEDNNNNLQSTRSMAQLYSMDDLSDISSGSSSLKPAKSLAELCNASDDELDAPGTHSLILQFENLGQGSK